MTLTLQQSMFATCVNGVASFAGQGGTPPYVYSVLTGSGTINPATGMYTAPVQASSDPATAYETIQVEDATTATATAQILVGSPFLLFCDVIQRELGLANGRVYLWDQKIMQPTDNGLYVAVSVPTPKPFGNVNRNVNGQQVQSVSMYAKVDLDIISRGPEARDRKEEVILAFNSIYAQQQQEACGFYIGKLPPGGGFINLSMVDGAAIPYRYRISVALQYFVSKTKAAPYFDNGFNTPVPLTNP